MRDSVKSRAEVDVDNIHCSSLLYPASHGIIAGYQIRQAWVLLHESMLTTLDNLLFLHLSQNDIQNELLHLLSQDGGEADQPAVPWVLLLAFIEGWSDIGFAPVLGHFSCSPRPFKDGREWLNDIHQLPQHSCVHSVGAHGFVGVQIA